MQPEPPQPVDTPRAAPSLKDLAGNAAGLALPLVAALAAVPLLIGELGLERFGVFSLLMAGLLYLGVLDLGLGTAITFRLSRGGEDDPRRAQTVSTAFHVVVGVGGLAAMILIVGAPAAAATVLPGEFEATQDLVWSIQVLAIAVPASLVSAIANGVLAAHRRFDLLNRIRVPMGVLTFVAPALICYSSPTLTAACAAVMFVRLAWMLMLLRVCKSLVPELRANGFDGSELRALWRFGAWLAVSNFVGLVMVYMDRFFLGLSVSAEQVARYVTPYEIATKVTLVPAAAMPVLFPLLVRELYRHRRGASEIGLNVRSGLAIAIICAVPASLMGVFSPWLIDVMGAGLLGSDSVLILRILCAGTLVNCLAQVHFVQIQARGRTDLIARVHLGELMFYLLLLERFTAMWGIVGVSLAWTLRVVVDAIILCCLVHLPAERADRRAGLAVFMATLSLSTLIAALAWSDSRLLAGLVAAVPLLLALVYACAWVVQRRSAMATEGQD